MLIQTREKLGLKAYIWSVVSLFYLAIFLQDEKIGLGFPLGFLLGQEDAQEECGGVSERSKLRRRFVAGRFRRAKWAYQ